MKKGVEILANLNAEGNSEESQEECLKVLGSGEGGLCRANAVIRGDAGKGFL